MRKNDLYNLVMELDARNNWGEIVKEYALELIDGWEGDDLEAGSLEGDLLNGATDWKDYSMSGNALIYHYELEERFKGFEGDLLQLQADALKDAFYIVQGVAHIYEDDLKDAAMKLVSNYMAYLDILAVFGTDLDAVRHHLEESLPGEAVKALGDYDKLRDGLDAAMEVLGC